MKCILIPQETQTSHCYQSEEAKANLTRAEIVMIKCFQIFNLREQLQEEHRGLPKYTTKDIAGMLTEMLDLLGHFNYPQTKII